MKATELLEVASVGIGATAILDLWMLVLARLGVQGLPMALIGRWVWHAARGHVFHSAIRKATPVAHEAPLGWIFHYAVGILFSIMLLVIEGPDWFGRPTVLPALTVGIATVMMPLFVMQPAMGAGFAASKTPTPLSNRLRSVANHAVFGVGLYVSAALIS